jgi:GNAT superfamily N-acetyltransferase
MWFRLSRAQFTQAQGEPNRASLRELVAGGTEPGLLAYAGGRPVGWCAVEPRAAYPALARSRILAPVDTTPVWSITCFFVARTARRGGVMAALLRAAVEHAAGHGATMVEAYPVEPRSGRMPDAFAYTGLASAFRDAGFFEVARRGATRPIMRYAIAR